MRLVLLAIAAAALPACTWVKPTISGESVRVAYDGNVSGCRDVGTVSVTVTDQVAFYHRPELKVRDELETLARNQAATMPADTITAKDEPHDGSQEFEAYVCGGVRMRERANVPPPSSKGEAETFPVKDH
ncbi:MAG TPA: DUF4156 domain-containing protein [Rudaea sp.]|nr:DUF4156 domain-containing protein [Rudaea sp.]